MLDRRTLLAAVTAAAATFAADAASSATTAAEDFDHPFQTPPGAHDDIGLLIYPGMTVLDIIGPYHFLCFMGGAKMHLVTTQSDLRPVVGDAGMGIVPSTTMADCPRDLALLIMPGGTNGTFKAATDPAVLDFVADRGRRARFVSSVCTGSLILGAAGLLRGRRATSHWTVVDNLAQFGAIPVRQRVVEDGNVITAAGVSAGLDSGLSLVARLRGRPLAEAALLMTEYAPEPPFRGGTVETARPAIRKAATDNIAPFVERVKTLRARSA